MKATKNWSKMLPAAMALALGLVVIGCKDATAVEGDVGIVGGVGINVGQAPQVDAVTVTMTTNGQYYIVSWDAVAEDLNYSLYFVQDGKMSNVWGGGPQRTYKYNPANGAQIPNDDFDKWYVRIDAPNLSLLTISPGAYKFGVRTTRLNASSVKDIVSDITWSEKITLTAGSEPSGVTATPAPDNTAFPVTWTEPPAPTGVFYSYDVEYSKDGGPWMNIVAYATPGNAISFDNTHGPGSYKFRVSVATATYTATSLPYYDITRVTPVRVESVASFTVTP
jgi:hypothetical protein